MLTSFLIMSFISILVIAITSLITYEILGFVWNTLPHLSFTPRLRVLLIIIPIFTSHIIAVWLYALVYFLVENYTSLGHLTGNISGSSMTYSSFMERLYFSASTYTSLGFGDIVPNKDLRMLASAEVLNGLVMIGWTISFTYLSMEKFWLGPRHNHKKHMSDNNE